MPPPDPEGDPNAPEPEFGEFQATDLAPMIAGIQAEIQQLGAISQTPYHYLLPQSGQPPSGESLKSAETGLVAKVKDSQLYKGEGLEEVFRLNFAFRGDERADDMGAEIMWVNTESRSEAVHTDALVKQKTAGVPDEVLWEGFGYSEREIARIKAIIDAMPPEPAPTIVSEVVPSGVPGQSATPPRTPAGLPPAVQTPPPAPMPNISHK